MLEVSNTSVICYRTCPKKWYWRYIVGLQPQKKPNALYTGTIIHSAFDMYFHRFSDGDVVKNLLETTNEKISEASLPDQEDLIISKYTALGMWVNFPRKDLSEYQEIKSELSFRTKILPGTYYVGKVDRLLLIARTGLWWLGELKTTGLPFQHFKNRANSSNQATGYVFGMREAGYDVKGIIYEILKKPLLRKRKEERCEAYGYRIGKDYTDRPDQYFDRHYVYRTEQDVDLFKPDLCLTAKEIKRCRRRGEFPRNTEACWIYNSECPYKKICFSEKLDKLTVDLYYERREDGREQKSREKRNIADTRSVEGGR